MNWKFVKFLVGCVFLFLGLLLINSSLEKGDLCHGTLDFGVTIYWMFLTKAAWKDFKASKAGGLE